MLKHHTTFEYSNLQLSSPVITDKEPVTVTCKIKNTGTRSGLADVPERLRLRGRAADLADLVERVDDRLAVNFVSSFKELNFLLENSYSV